MAHNPFDNRHFCTISTTEIPALVFADLKITSAATLRKTNDGSTTFIKWDGDDMPASVSALTTRGDVLTLPEIRDVLEGDEWNPDGGG